MQETIKFRDPSNEILLTENIGLTVQDKLNNEFLWHAPLLFSSIDEVDLFNLIIMVILE